MPKRDEPKMYHCNDHPNQPIGYYWTKNHQYVCIDCFALHQIDKTHLRRVTTLGIEQIAQNFMEQLAKLEKQIRECKLNLTKVFVHETVQSDKILEVFDRAKYLLIGEAPDTRV